MRYIGAGNLTLLAANEVKLCRCVKLTLRNGTVIGLTDHDANLSISAVTYYASYSLAVGAIRWTNRLENEVTELRGIYGHLTEANARLGLYNFADVEIFLAEWATPALVMPLKRGKLVSVLPHGSGWIGTVRSLAYCLSAKLIVDEVTKTCTADLGDARCGVTPATFVGTITGSTTTTITASAFTPPATPADLIGGRFELTTGTLTWFQNRIKAYDVGTKTFTFVRPFPEAPAVSSTFRAHEGCPKTKAACKDRFANLANYRGFNDVPDRDESAFLPVNMAEGGYVASTGEDD